MSGTTMSLRNHKTNGRASQRGRKHKPQADLDELLAEASELGTEEVEALLHEFAEEGGPDLQIENSAADELDSGDEGSSEDDTLSDVWVQKAGRAPLLTPAQEITLAKRIERGDQRAKEELLNANVRLVASVARKYLGRGLPLEDLMQEGLLGLLRATEKYNYRRGYRFSTYATFWVRQAITRALANQGRAIRLPAHVVDTLGRLARVREQLRQRLGRMPTRGELAQASGLSEAKLEQLLASASSPVSLEAPVGAEGEGRLGEFVRAEEAGEGLEEESSPSAGLFRWLVREELAALLSSLTPRERAVLELRYGLGELGGGEAHTLEETGRRLHITRERARQIEAKALEKLRRPHASARLKELVG